MKFLNSELLGALRTARSIIAVALAVGAVAGCSDPGVRAAMTGRWGPDPALKSADVDTVMRDQSQVLLFIELDAGFVKSDGAGGYVPTPAMPPQLWYSVAQWGFNIGRQDCEVYLNTLYRLNRQKQRNDSALAALAAGTAAILTPAHASAASLSIVAAVFGLSTAMNDALYQTYLFTEAPGLISTKVKDLQDTYQKSLSAASITTPDQAYSAIQHYYTICLPESIEGVLLEAVATSSAKIKTTGKTDQGGTNSVLNRPALVQKNTIGN